MLIILLIAILTIFTGITLARRNRGNHALGAKIALAISYVLLIVQSIEAERAAVQADTQRLAGGTNGWFGKYWALAWILNLLAIIGLHVYLSRIRQPKDTSNSLIS
jgi:phosphotransferase system  glucose/maltose/N-acetylglucosamine-specific IIC component